MATTAGDTVLTIDDVHAARETIAGRLHRTPTFSSRQLSEQTGGTVYLKAECFQRTGSFKPRGVLNKLASLSAEEKARGVISISAGNHAQALAYASALEGIDALIVMWASASAQKIAAARGYGATIDTEPRGAFRRGELPRSLPGAGRRRGARHRGRHQGCIPVPLRAREDRLRGGRSGHDRGAHVPKGQAGTGRDRRRRYQRRQRSPRNSLCYPGRRMKADLHPDYVLTNVHCSCGNSFETRSTKPELHVEVCAACHPFYTGKQKLMDTGGRVERFQRRLEKAGGSRRA